MKLFHLIEGVFLKLSVVPGLGFLYEYVHELETRKATGQRVMGKYVGYGRALRDAGGEARHGGHHGHDEHGGHEEHAGHGKKSKPAKRLSRWGRRRDQPAPRPRAKEEPEDLEEDNYEDDDFESYLQH